MPTIIPVDYCQANVVLALADDAEPIVNTFGIHATDEGVINSDLADAVMTEYAAAYGGNLSVSYSVMQVVLYGFNGLGPSAVHISTMAPVPGTETAAVLPQNCAGLVRKRTDMAGRRGRGRFYLPSMVESEVGPTGLLTTGYRNTLQASSDAFLEGIQLIPFVEDMVVLHRSEGAGVEPAPTPVQSLQVDVSIATQRRRLRP